MAAEDLSPWVKIGDVICRAESIRETGGTLHVRARVRDQQVMKALRAQAPDDRWGTSSDAQVTYGNRSGVGRIDQFEVETQSAAAQTVELTIKIEWASGRDSMAMSTGGLSHEDIVEAGVRAGYLHEPLPQPMTGLGMSSLADTTDPLTQLQGLQLPEGAIAPLGRLLAVEHLVGTRRAVAVDEFTLGPASGGRRRLRMAWSEPRAYSNVEPGRRMIEGDRPW
jgi:hypothetical protein